MRRLAPDDDTLAKGELEDGGVCQTGPIHNVSSLSGEAHSRHSLRLQGLDQSILTGQHEEGAIARMGESMLWHLGEGQRSFALTLVGVPRDTGRGCAYTGARPLLSPLGSPVGEAL